MKDTLHTEKKKVTHIKEFYHTEKNQATTTEKEKHNDFPCQNRYYIYIFTHEKKNTERIFIYWFVFS